MSILRGMRKKGRWREDIEKIRGVVRSVREKRECLDALVESRFSAGAGPPVVDVPEVPVGGAQAQCKNWPLPTLSSSSTAQPTEALACRA